jgi:hypothetical protein
VGLVAATVGKSSGIDYMQQKQTYFAIQAPFISS